MKKKILFIVLILLIIGGGVAFYAYRLIYSGFDIENTQYIYIDASKDYQKIVEDVRKIGRAENLTAFEQIASKMNYPSNIKTGKYAIEPNMSAIDLVRRLQKGEQTPHKITFNNIRTTNDLAQRLSEQLMLSKEQLDRIFADTTAFAKYGFDTYTIPALFIPNTYELYWDMSADNLLARMNKEHIRFWTDERTAKAKELNLTPIQVAILASIVEEECTYSDEYPTVAGLYLNRLKRGQALQADPTVKFAVGDFSLRRILNVHLKTDSPYNTYQHTGLPPGPIRIPSIKGLEAVLNYSTHDFFYMCAKDDLSGRHSFAKTHPEHVRNALRYHQSLNKRNIY